jgi:inorganic triphosphatase YgiF
MTTPPVETELKLWLRPEDVEAFRNLPRLRRARPCVESLRSVYFDTPDFKLARKGIALRVRKTRQGWVQTLKTEGERRGGLSTRLELESLVARALPDLARLPADVVDKLVGSKWRAALVPVYETRFTRTAWNLRMPERGRVEVALDVGAILAGKQSEPLCEVELELKSGDAGVLHELALTLAQQVLLIPFDASKAERGSQLAAGRTRGPVGVLMPELEGRQGACAACARIMRAYLAQLQANLPGLLQSDVPEYLHQARVAVRRLRSAAGMFKRVCPLPDEEMGRVAELGRVLGEARDWDVFVFDTLPALLRTCQAGNQTLLVRRAQAARRKARATAQHLVCRPQTGMDLLAIHRWLNGLETVQGRSSLERHARQQLAGLHRKVLAAAKDFAEQSPGQRHVLRIQVKRLRYALDYLGGLFGEQENFADDFALLQDELGELNDTYTALHFLVLLNRDGRLNGLAVSFARSLEERMHRRLNATGRTVRKFSHLQPPWQKQAKG